MKHREGGFQSEARPPKRIVYHKQNRMSVANSTKEAEKRKKELNWFLFFQEKCPDCPRSNPVQLPPPAPDILFKEDDLGIEITQYLLDQGHTGSHPCRLETTRECISRMAQSLYESQSRDCLHVTIRWANSLCPEKHEQKELAQAISQAVLARDKFNRTCCIEWREFRKPLPQKYIDSFLIASQEESCWTNGTALCFGTLRFMMDSFQALLDAKQGHIEAYRKTAPRTWLLIVADKSLFCSDISSHGALLENSFNSGFNRVFVLDEHRDKLLELRLASARQWRRHLMNTKGFPRLGVPLGEATRRATDLLPNLYLQSEHISLLILL